MKIGFTGTRFGMTDDQKKSLKKLIEELNGPSFCRDAEFHHGDCVGADDQAATLAHECGLFSVICHPPIDTKLQAGNPYATEAREPKTHFARNREIVNETDVLVACPYHDTRQQSGGTSYTIVYAEKQKKLVYIIWPNGVVEKAK